VGQPAAKQNDAVTATDTHIVMVPAPPGPPVPTPLPHPFNGILNAQLSKNVNVMGLPAAIVGSQADNTPPHIPTPPGTSFQNPPKNKGTIKLGSRTVLINGKGAARNSDVVETCNDPADAPVGTVVAQSSVLVGG
jgi:uncharacterized Zn-binding protein involved in type VI secretion